MQRVQPQLKKRIGRGAFWVSGLSHLADWKPSSFTLEIEGQSYTGTFAAIGKAARYGGDLAITPGARLEEPEFEICIIETTSRASYLRLLSYAVRSGMLRAEIHGVIAYLSHVSENLWINWTRRRWCAPVTQPPGRR